MPERACQAVSAYVDDSKNATSSATIIDDAEGKTGVTMEKRMTSNEQISFCVHEIAAEHGSSVLQVVPSTVQSVCGCKQTSLHRHAAHPNSTNNNYVAGLTEDLHVIAC